jgi:intracellular septation protein
MKLLIDFLPVLAFFIAYKAFDIYVATSVLIVAFTAQFLFDWGRNGKINKMHLISLVLVLVFGGITLFLRDEKFIQWKPTVVNWLFAAAFVLAPVFTKKTLIQRLMEKTVELAPGLWAQLNSMWVLFFLLSGATNLYVVYNYDEETWVNFKLFGMLGLTFIFILLQGVWLSRKATLLEESQSEPENVSDKDQN